MRPAQINKTRARARPGGAHLSSQHSESQAGLEDEGITEGTPTLPTRGDKARKDNTINKFVKDLTTGKVKNGVLEIRRKKI